MIVTEDLLKACPNCKKQPTIYCLNKHETSIYCFPCYMEISIVTNNIAYINRAPKLDVIRYSDKYIDNNLFVYVNKINTQDFFSIKLDLGLFNIICNSPFSSIIEEIKIYQLFS